MMWQRRCIPVKDYEYGSLWRSVKKKYFFTVPEVVDGSNRWVKPEHWAALEEELDAVGLTKR